MALGKPFGNRRTVESKTIDSSKEYWKIFDDLKRRIGQAQARTALAVNRGLVELYWEIGAVIVEQQNTQAWGRSVVERLSKDLQNEYPGIQGFSAQNIWHMRGFYLAWTEGLSNLQQLVGDLDASKPPEFVSRIPWGHNLQLLSKLKNPIERIWYARKTVEHGWSRSVLVHQIESGLHERQGKALSNFPKTLPPPQSDLARELLKDPYNFDFLTLAEEARERELEKSLLDHLKDFLIELGHGFAFVGNQFQLNVGGQGFFIDLLFYHTRLHAYVVIELKATPFEPEFAGKMNFYLAAVDKELATPGDNPAIGIILCKERNQLVVEYALAEIRRPIGVAQYRLTRRLPEQFKDELPSREEFMAMLPWRDPEQNLDREPDRISKPSKKPAKKKKPAAATKKSKRA